MTAVQHGLFWVQEVANPKAIVLLVHGLGGDAIETWGDASLQWYWPRNLANEFQNISVASVRYPADKFALSLAGEGMSVEEHARAILGYMVATGKFKTDVVIIAHSLGGVVTKNILEIGFLSRHPDWRQLCSRVKAVSFLATPHHGAAIATIAKVARLPFRRKIVDQLSSGDDGLYRINEWYRSAAPKYGIETTCFYETLDFGGLRVVDRTSANPGVENCEPIPVHADHFQICKPTDAEHPVYIQIRRIVDRVINRDDRAGESVETGEGVEVVEPEILQEYEYYKTWIDEDERLDLESKMTLGGRGYDLDHAKEAQDRFARRITRNILQLSSIDAYTKALAEIKMRFNRIAKPEIRGGTPQHKIDRIIVDDVITPVVRSGAPASGAAITHDVMNDAFYYLMGNCHIRWDK